LINSGFPAVNLFDRLSFALQLMDEYDVQHLPVLCEEKYAGIISKNDLLDGVENNLLATVEIKANSVKNNQSITHLIHV